MRIWLYVSDLNPSGDAIARAIEDALQKAGNPRINYINAHGTATRANDIIESRAIQNTLGMRVPVSSTKSLAGHLLGAAGAVEATICLLARCGCYKTCVAHFSGAKPLGCEVAQAGAALMEPNTVSNSGGFGVWARAMATRFNGAPLPK